MSKVWNRVYIMSKVWNRVYIMSQVWNRVWRIVYFALLGVGYEICLHSFNYYFAEHETRKEETTGKKRKHGKSE